MMVKRCLVVKRFQAAREEAMRKLGMVVPPQAGAAPATKKPEAAAPVRHEPDS